MAGAGARHHARPAGPGKASPAWKSPYAFLRVAGRGQNWTSVFFVSVPCFARMWAADSLATFQPCRALPGGPPSGPAELSSVSGPPSEEGVARGLARVPAAPVWTRFIPGSPTVLTATLAPRLGTPRYARISRRVSDHSGEAAGVSCGHTGQDLPTAAARCA